MSSRALRRLEKAKGHSNLSPPSNDEEQELKEENTMPAPSSAFALLANSESESESEADSSDSVVDETVKRTSSPEAVPRKHLKKGRAKTKVSKEHSDISLSSKDEIDELLEKLNLTASTATGQKETDRKELSHSIFSVDLDHLDPASELKRKVGGVDREDTSDSLSQLPDVQAGSARRLVAFAKHQQKKTKQHRHRKQLIVPRLLWPKVTSALVELRMQRIKHDLYGEQDTFQFVPKDLYSRQFEEFTELVELGDIELIYAFVRKHPLHVDALLVVSDFMRMSSSASDALELTERAVYILEKCTLAVEESSSVDLTSGRLRMPYDIFENRRLHLALLRYVQFLTKRGCYRTAFEFCKILWSLDPLIDPMGVRLIVDFLAIQSDQLTWFDHVYRQIDEDYPWLANWAYSAALCSFLRETSRGASASSGKGKSSLRTPSTDAANEKLQTAILTHPWVIPLLAKACGLQVDEAGWRSTMGIPNTSAHDHVGALREAIARVYAQRCGPLWKSLRTCAWLETNIGIALSRAAAGNAPVSMIDYRPVLMEALPIFRHTIVSDLNNVQVSIPVTISSGPVHLYDPLPPEQVIDEDEAFSTGPSKCSIQ